MGGRQPRGGREAGRSLAEPGRHRGAHLATLKPPRGKGKHVGPRGRASARTLYRPQPAAILASVVMAPQQPSSAPPPRERSLVVETNRRRPTCAEHAGRCSFRRKAKPLRGLGCTIVWKGELNAPLPSRRLGLFIFVFSLQAVDGRLFHRRWREGSDSVQSLCTMRGELRRGDKPPPPLWFLPRGYLEKDA